MCLSCAAIASTSPPSLQGGNMPHPDSLQQSPPQPHLTEARGATTKTAMFLCPARTFPQALQVQLPTACRSQRHLTLHTPQGRSGTRTYEVTLNTASSSLLQSQSTTVLPPDSFLRPTHFSLSPLPSSWSNPSSFLTGTSVQIPPVYSGPSLTSGQ